jgi:hypothetical protein
VGILWSLEMMASVDIKIGGKDARCLTANDVTAAQGLYAKMPHIRGKTPLFFGEIAEIAPNNAIASDVWGLIPDGIQSLYQRLGLVEPERGEWKSKAVLRLYFAIYAAREVADTLEFSTMPQDILKAPGNATPLACFGEGFSFSNNWDDAENSTQLHTRSFPSGFLRFLTTKTPSVQHKDVMTLCFFVPSVFIKNTAPVLIQAIYGFREGVTLTTPLASLGNSFSDAADKTLVGKCITKVSGISPSASSSSASGPSTVPPPSIPVPPPPGPPSFVPPPGGAEAVDKALRERILGTGAPSVNFKEKQAYAAEVLKVFTTQGGENVGDQSKVKPNEDFYNWLKEYRKRSPSATTASRPGTGGAATSGSGAAGARLAGGPAGGMSYTQKDVNDAKPLGYPMVKMQQYLNAKAWAEKQKPKAAIPSWDVWQSHPGNPRKVSQPSGSSTATPPSGATSGTSSTGTATALASRTGAEVTSPGTVSLSCLGVENASRDALRDAQQANGATAAVALGPKLNALSTSLGKLSEEVKRLENKERDIVSTGGVIPSSGGVKATLNKLTDVIALKAEVGKLKAKVEGDKFKSKKGDVEAISRKLDEIFGSSGKAPNTSTTVASTSTVNATATPGRASTPSPAAVSSTVPAHRPPPSGGSPGPAFPALRKSDASGSSTATPPRAPAAKSDAELKDELGYPNIISFNKAKTWAENQNPKVEVPTYADWQKNPASSPRPSGSAAGATPPGGGSSGSTGSSIPFGGIPKKSTVVRLSRDTINTLGDAFTQAQNANNATATINLNTALNGLSSALDNLRAVKAEEKGLLKAEIEKEGGLQAEIKKLEEKVKDGEKFESKKDNVGAISGKLNEILGSLGG